MIEKEHIKIALQLVEEKFNKGNSANWKDKDFKELNNLIFDKAKINISPNTLRRLYGRLKTYKKEYSPQKDTLNALAAYLDFKHWSDFTLHIEKNLSNYIHYLIKKTNNKYKLSLISMFLFLFVVLSLILLYSIRSKDKPESDFKYFAKNITGENLVGTSPLTVIINYEYDKNNTDSFFIDFADDTRPIYLPKEHKLITYTYSNPGLYNITVLNDLNQPIKKINTLITTKGWEFIIGLDKTKLAINKSTKIESFYLKNNLHLPDTFIKRRYLKDFPNRIYYTILQKVDTFNIDGDNFSFVLKFRNPSKEGGIHCYNSKIILGGSQQEIKIELVGEGCFHWASITLSENEFSGKHNKLNNLSIDLSYDRVLKIINKNKNTSFYVDDKLVFNNSYKKSVGEIIKTAIMFRGTGSIDYIKLRDINTEKEFSDSFQ